MKTQDTQALIIKCERLQQYCVRLREQISANDEAVRIIFETNKHIVAGSRELFRRIDVDID